MGLTSLLVGLEPTNAPGVLVGLKPPSLLVGFKPTGALLFLVGLKPTLVPWECTADQGETHGQSVELQRIFS